MKRILLTLSFIAINIAIVKAESFIIDNLEYYIIDGTNTVSVSKGTTVLTGALTIPSTVEYNGTTYIVTTISRFAFSNCSSLTSVSVPNSVTSIGENAFTGCSSLVSMVLPFVGNKQHSQSDNYQYPFGYIFGTRSYDGGSATTQNYYGSSASSNSVTSSTFYIPTSLKNVVITGSSYIPFGAFYKCTGLVSVFIPSSVTSIGSNAFYYTAIRKLCYEGSTEPANMNYASSHIVLNVKYIGDFLYTITSNSPRTVAVVRYIGGDSTITIPEKVKIGISEYAVTGISDYAFDYCANLTTIELPNNITTIGDYAFSHCSNLTTLVMASQVESIGSNILELSNNISKVIVQRSVPPTINASTFSGLDLSKPIYVPCDNVGDYTSATYWSDMNIVGNYVYEFDVATANPTMGYAEIITQPSCGVQAVIKANSYEGFEFKEWNDGNTENPRTLTIDQNTIMSAYFHHHINVSITSSDDSRGSVSDASGVYHEIGDITFSATPNYGYVFEKWSDGNTDNPRTITLTHDTAFEAFFILDKFNLQVTVNNSVMGSATGSGTYDYLSENGISATANYGYHFVQWSDGVTERIRTISITKDTIIEAEFSVNQYAITLQSNDEERGSVSGGGGFNYLTNNQIKATPNYGYVFEKWSDNITINPRTIALTRDTAFTAIFVLDKFNLQVTSDNDELGSVAGGKTAEYKEDVEISATATAAHHHFTGWTDGNRQNPRMVQVISDTAFVATFAIDSFRVRATSSTDELGVVRGGGLYAYGTAIEVKALPQPHCHFVEWSNGAIGTVQTFNVEKDTAIAAVFAIDSHRLQVASADSTKGTVTGSGNYDYGRQITVSATAVAGCYFTGWSDGTTANPRIITIESDTTVVANFEQMLEFSITVVPSDTARGTVSGSGNYVSGTEATLSATPRQHYLFSQWSDGRTDNPRTVRVIADATYKAVFVPEQYNVVLSQNNADMGMVSGSGVYSYGDMVSCLAKPYQNYHFVQWSNGETANPYEFSISDNQILTAYFAAGAVTAIEDEATAEPIIYAVGKTIIVENATNEILVYDAMGKLVGRAGRDVPWRVSTGTLTITVNVSGVYIVKTGNVVMRVVVE